jgi:hypothetical protein
MTAPPGGLAGRYTRPQPPPGTRAAAATALTAPTVAVFALFFAALFRAPFLYLLALAAVAVTWSAVRAYRHRVSPELRAAMSALRVPPPEVDPPTADGWRTALRRDRYLELDRDGLTIDRQVTTRHALAADDDGRLRLRWEEISRWTVGAGADGPTLYELALAGGGRLCILRPAVPAEREAELLDAVQRYGRIPVVVTADLGPTPQRR